MLTDDPSFSDGTALLPSHGSPVERLAALFIAYLRQILGVAVVLPIGYGVLRQQRACPSRGSGG